MTKSNIVFERDIECNIYWILRKADMQPVAKIEEYLGEFILSIYEKARLSHRSLTAAMDTAIQQLDKEVQS